MFFLQFSFGLSFEIQFIVAFESGEREKKSLHLLLLHQDLLSHQSSNVTMIPSRLSSNVSHARLGVSSASSILKVGGSRIASNSLKKRTLARRNHHQQLPTSTLSRCSTSTRSTILNDDLRINENSIRWFSSSRRDSTEKGKEKEKEKSGMTLSVTQQHRDNKSTIGQVLEGEFSVENRFIPDQRCIGAVESIRAERKEHLEQ